jgi:UDP-glucuronate 4-epimerase
MKILVTGSAGFVGSNVAKALLERGDEVIGVDNFNDYYDVSLKEYRTKELKKYDGYKLYRIDIEDEEELEKVFKENKIDKVCHLAAQAGVRYSIENPYVYGTTNVAGFVNMIHLSKEAGIKHFVYASSSSVYGNNDKIPYSEEDAVENPISLYAATKRANELIAYTYNHLYKMNTIGLRFFTVYGPAGRPDMAYFKFANRMAKGEEIDVYNYGKDMKRDFTYIDDIVDGVLRSIDCDYGYEIFNLGKGDPDELGIFIETLEKHMGIKAKKNLLPMQPGDVMITYADTTKTEKMLGYKPTITLDEGLKKFAQWYKGYYKIS